MNKKAIVSSQITWIFILVAGAIILIFFVSIAQKQKFISEQSINADIIKDIATIINGAVSGEKTETPVDIVYTSIDADCNEYRIGSSTEYFGSIVAFSPDFIKGSRMIAYSYDWELPFKATNFLYLTSNEIRYILVYNDDSKEFMKKINETLPEQMNKEAVEISEFNGDYVKDRNNYKVRVVFFNTDKKSLDMFSKTDDKDVSSVRVIPDSNGDFGKVEFYKGKDNTPQGDSYYSYYAKKEALIGAIFSEDKENYECSMKKAFKNLNLLSSIYIERTSALAGSYSAGDVCQAKLQDAGSTLSDIKTQSGGLYDNTDSNLDESKIKTIYSDAYDFGTGLEHKNEVLKIHSCPVIY